MKRKSLCYLLIIALFVGLVPTTTFTTKANAGLVDFLQWGTQLAANILGVINQALGGNFGVQLAQNICQVVANALKSFPRQAQAAINGQFAAAGAGGGQKAVTPAGNRFNNLLAMGNNMTPKQAAELDQFLNNVSGALETQGLTVDKDQSGELTELLNKIKDLAQDELGMNLESFEQDFQQAMNIANEVSSSVTNISNSVQQACNSCSGGNCPTPEAIVQVVDTVISEINGIASLDIDIQKQAVYNGTAKQLIIGSVASDQDGKINQLLQQVDQLEAQYMDKVVSGAGATQLAQMKQQITGLKSQIFQAKYI
ncbi:MAG: hypothetical protein PHQ23_00430 [Candidatus Wallbacteria bacterium]|nr:hypothetical protein [Candidatus Wallbacteria bacterium]